LKKRKIKMHKEIIWIGAGSALGGISRYAVSKWMSNVTTAPFPLSTFSINILGSFLIGVLMALQSKQGFSTTTLLFLTTGFCGGFTTFSTFSLENIELIKQGYLGTAILYMLSSLGLGLLSVYIGHRMMNGL